MAGGWSRRRWVIVAGVAVLVLAIGAVAFALGRPSQTAGEPPAPTTSGVATPTVTPSQQVTTSTTPTASATSTPTKEQTPYCKAFARITASSVETGEGEGSVDFAALKKTFDRLITLYTDAAKLAPASLADDYDKVLDYLKQGRKAVTSKDLNELKTMVRSLSKLNDTMASIQSHSTELCG